MFLNTDLKQVKCHGNKAIPVYWAKRQSSVNNLNNFRCCGKSHNFCGCHTSCFIQVMCHCYYFHSIFPSCLLQKMVSLSDYHVFIFRLFACGQAQAIVQKAAVQHTYEIRCVCLRSFVLNLDFPLILWLVAGVLAECQARICKVVALWPNFCSTDEWMDKDDIIYGFTDDFFLAAGLRAGREHLGG